MYSSVVGGIVLDPCMMVIPIDDHMVHRGHGVFDTATIADGLSVIMTTRSQFLDHSMMVPPIHSLSKISI
jgi:hypothetical protein